MLRHRRLAFLTLVISATLFPFGVFAQKAVAPKRLTLPPECSEPVATPASPHAPSAPKAAELGSETREYQAPKDCARTGTCDLVRAKFWIKRYGYEERRTVSTEPTQGTLFYAWYETKTPEALTKYAFVQFMRGSMTHVMIHKGKSESRVIPIIHREVLVPLRFTDWVVDSESSSPTYTGDFSGGTLDHHRYAIWLADPNAFPLPNNTCEYRKAKPPYPRLGMVDSVDPAFVRTWRNGRVEAKNVMLEFKTCLYRTSDIPGTTVRTPADLPAPILCHEWSAIHYYDTQKKRLVRGQRLPTPW